MLLRLGTFKKDLIKFTLYGHTTSSKCHQLLRNIKFVVIEDKYIQTSYIQTYFTQTTSFKILIFKLLILKLLILKLHIGAQFSQTGTKK